MGWSQPDGTPWAGNGTNASLGSEADLVLAFGAREALLEAEHLEALKAAYPNAHIAGCSTAGEIVQDVVLEGTLSVTAISFARTAVRLARVPLSAHDGVGAASEALMEALAGGDLAHVFVLSDGLNVNASALARGLQAGLPGGVHATGGLAGDADRFEQTPLWADDVLAEPSLVGIGFYGTSLDVGFGAVGGWHAFGPERRITRSEENVLYELDGRSALDLYKLYLGPHADGLPASGLLFPLAIRDPEAPSGCEIVRTTLGVDESTQSIQFAGDVPEGAVARFMMAPLERVIDAAGEAAAMAAGAHAPDLALLVSCAGRNWALGQRTDEEVEVVRERLGSGTALAGFYSYGELAPVGTPPVCELHNQTMTVTTLSER